jgi:radical SAM superfamily enzyme YgiQ (UPF0313 family)
MSMLNGRAVDLDACREMGIAIFAGEAEGRLESVIIDVAAGSLAPVYNFMKDLPGMEGAPVPFLPKRYVQRTLGLSASFDAGRGCPYQCPFCASTGRRAFENFLSPTIILPQQGVGIDLRSPDRAS